jgi:hypothetical protein
MLAPLDCILLLFIFAGRQKRQGAERNHGRKNRTVHMA